MASKSVAPPGLIDQIAGDQFAWLINSPIVELGLVAIIFTAIASKIFSSS